KKECSRCEKMRSSRRSSARSRSKRSAVSRCYNTRRMTRVLIIDDDDFILDIYAKKFSTEGWEVVSVYSGKEGIELLRKGERFDGILFDLLMPGYTGLEMLRDVRAEN